MSQKTRVFFTTDIHGSEKCFRKFVNAAKFYEANVLVLGGDITGKTVVPIVEQSDGTYTSRFLGNTMKLKTSKEVGEAVKNMRDAGYYTYRTTKEEVKEIGENSGKVDALFEKLILESIDGWLKLADERLAGTGVKCYISPGNDDTLAIDSHLVDTGVVFNPEGKVVRIDDRHEMITLGYTNHTPWNSPREVDESRLEAMLEEMNSKVEDMKSCIFNVHCPPINTIIDQAPALDETFRPIVRGGHVQMVSAGSSAVRTAIEKQQPLVGIHGHIHESHGTVKIGRTQCFNPGSEYTEGVLRGLLLDLEDDKVKNYLFTQG